MEYKKKLEYAEKYAEELQGSKTKEQVVTELKADGLYKADIDAVMLSVRNVLADTYLLPIQEALINGEDVYESDKFKSLDNGIVNDLVERAVSELNVQEKKKMAQLYEKGMPPEKILQHVNPKYLPLTDAAKYLVRLQEAKEEEKGDSGFAILNIIGGLGLIVGTFVVLSMTGRLFYVLPIVGLIWTVKGVAGLVGR